MSHISPTAHEVPAPGESPRHQSIGHVLCERHGLDPAELPRIRDHQQRTGIRFGEAAAALGLVTNGQVLHALSTQFRYPCVGSFGNEGADEELVVACNPLSADAEAFRQLRSELMAGVLAGAGSRSLAILSPDIGDGRTYVAANLAIACAQLGGMTLLVDADLRTPRQHELFGAPGRTGLSTLLAGRDLDTSVIHQVAQLPSLHVLPSGPPPPNPAELLHSSMFRRLVQEWTDKFDFVLIDTAAATSATDARAVAAVTDAALVVARRHESRAADLRRLLTWIEKAPTLLAGVVVNEH